VAKIEKTLLRRSCLREEKKEKKYSLPGLQGARRLYASSDLQKSLSWILPEISLNTNVSVKKKKKNDVR
jgi:hypothetical protein